MHELGVAFHIADMVKGIALENGATLVHSVILQVGQVSTVIPEYLIDVWNWNCKREPVLNGCELLVETIPAVTHCESCGQDYDTVPQGKICPCCGSDQTYLLTGNEVQIKEITVK